MGRILALGLGAVIALAVAGVLVWRLGAAAPARVPVPTGDGDPLFADPPLRGARDAITAARQAGDPVAEVIALHTYATLLRARGRIAEAAASLCAAIAAACVVAPALAEQVERELTPCCGDLQDLVNSALNAGTIDVDRALTWYGQMHDGLKGSGRTAAAAQVRHNMAGLALDGHRDADARRWIEEAIALRRALLAGNPRFRGPLAWSLNTKGYALYKAQQFDEALAVFHEVLRVLAPVESNRLLTDVGCTALENMALVAKAWIATGQPAKAVAAWDAVWSQARVASNAHQELVLSKAVEIHLAAGQVDRAAEAVQGLLRINALRPVRLPEAEGTIRYGFAKTLFETGHRTRALAELTAAEPPMRACGWELGLAWLWHLRGRMELARATDPLVAAVDRRTAAEAANTAFETARAIFERCGRHRNGLMKSLEGLRDTQPLRGDPEGGEAYRKKLEALLGQPTPPLLPRAVFDPPDEVWNNLYDNADPGTPVVEVVRDQDAAGSWVLTDALDPDHPRVRVPFEWGWREVHLGRMRFSIAGQWALAGRFKVFLPKGWGARILRAGVVVPLGPTEVRPGPVPEAALQAAAPQPFGPPVFPGPPGEPGRGGHGGDADREPK